MACGAASNALLDKLHVLTRSCLCLCLCLCLRLRLCSLSVVYSRRDWLRWDSYNMTAFGMPGLSDQQQLLRQSTFTRSYFDTFTRMQADFMYGGDDSLYATFQSMSSMPDESWATRFKQSPRYPFVNEMWVNCSFAVSSAHSDWLAERIALGESADEVPWVMLPGVQKAASTLEEILDIWWNMQQMNHTIANRADGKSFDGFGYFRSFVGDTVDGLPLDARDYASVGEIFWPMVLATHFAQVLSNAALRRARKHIGALLSAHLYSMESIGLDMPYPYIRLDPDPFFGLDYRAFESQMYPGSVSVAAAFLLRSEGVLKSRPGVWTPQDNITVTNQTAGEFTPADLKSLSFAIVSAYVGWYDKFGIQEFLGDYLGPAFSYAPLFLLHSPTAEVLSLWERFWMIHWTDMIVHYIPALGAASATTSRQNQGYINGLLYGPNNNWDNYENPLYVQSALRPLCNEADGGCLLPITTIIRDASALPTLTARVLFSLYQSLGLGAHPLQLLLKYLPMEAKSVKQRYQIGEQQDRFNFVTRNYSIGYVGVSEIMMGNSFWNVARLAGKPRWMPQVSNSNSTALG